MTAIYNGLIPQPGIVANNLTVTEDNNPVSNLEVTGCDESGEAAIVFCVDISSSILRSAGDSWNIYPSYFNAFAKFISAIPKGSRYSLVLFTDTSFQEVMYYYPGPARPNGFYTGQNPIDSADFENNVRNQSFTFGFADVDSAIHLSANLLQYQPYQEKAIVLVSDDAIYNTPFYDSLLNAMGITLYVMELGTDDGPPNKLVTHPTGGIYAPAPDSAQWSPTMQEIEEYVFGEHCMIRYLSTEPCPWEKLHNISLTLNYKSLSNNLLEQYSLGRNIFDHTPPIFAIDTPVYITRLVQASKNYPCTIGIRDFQDSSSYNFSLLAQYRNFPNLVYDSLIVIDSMQPAKAVYHAEDSSYDHDRQEVLYHPKPDTLPPLITASQSTGGMYQMLVTENRPWDMGLKTMLMEPGAQNVVLDSFNIVSRRVGVAWLHKVNLSAATSACFDAVDSAGNIAMYCIRGDSLTGDTIPPVIVQDPIASPRLQITGRVTEENFKDIGIKSIAIFPAVNAKPASITYLSAHRATFSVPIIDSLQPVRDPIFAVDSVGNFAWDTLRYDPEPDVTAPVCSVESPDGKTRIFHVTELAPWDRGIASVMQIGNAVNLTVGPVIYTSVYQAQQQFTIIDPFSPGSAVIKATDSAGHDCETTIYIDSIIRPLVPFTPEATLVDFGTVYAPSTQTKTFQITNPNGSPVLVTKLSQTGDAGVFSSDMAKNMILGAKETKTFAITFNPILLGNWRSDWVIANDTMQLATVEAIGNSIGSVQITIDTANAAYTQLTSKFTVAISAQPDPINLDTISFTLDYDADMVELQAPVNNISNYSLIPNPVSYGKMQYQLLRKDKNLTMNLSFGSSTFDVPFYCNVSRHDTSLLQLENIFIGQQSTASYSPGMITVGNQCGDQTLRSYLNGVLPLQIKSVVPNPANGFITVHIESHGKSESVLAIINNLGEITLRQNITIDGGESSHTLDLSKLPSGSYQLILTSGESITSRLIQIVH